MFCLTPSATPLAGPNPQPAYDPALVRIAVLVFCFVAVLFGILIYAISESRASFNSVQDTAVRPHATDDNDETLRNGLQRRGKSQRLCLQTLKDIIRDRDWLKLEDDWVMEELALAYDEMWDDRERLEGWDDREVKLP